MTKKARIDNGEKTDSSANGSGKTGERHGKESDWTALSHYEQNEMQNEAVKLLGENWQYIF